VRHSVWKDPLAAILGIAVSSFVILSFVNQRQDSAAFSPGSGGRTVQAAPRGQPQRLTRLAWSYLDDQSPSHDVHSAAALLERGCHGGDALACTSLGSMYLSGQSLMPDMTKAASLLRQGCDGGGTLGRELRPRPRQCLLQPGIGHGVRGILLEGWAGGEHRRSPGPPQCSRPAGSRQGFTGSGRDCVVKALLICVRSRMVAAIDLGHPRVAMDA